MPRQDSLHDQLKTVYDLANKAGCYDAADFIRRKLEKTERLLIEQDFEAIDEARRQEAISDYYEGDQNA